MGNLVHFARRLTAKGRDGKHVTHFGMRVGYWPCLRAPFIEFGFGRWVFEFRGGKLVTDLSEILR